METTISETREAAIRRLAAKARSAGVQLRVDRRDGRHYASSASRPGVWHLLTGYSCDCIGFQRHQRCMHHSALLAALKWVGDEDPTPEPTPAPAVALVPDTECRSCLGSGYERAYRSGRLDDWEPSPCLECGSSGEIIAA